MRERSAKPTLPIRSAAAAVVRRRSPTLECGGPPGAQPQGEGRSLSSGAASDGSPTLKRRLERTPPRQAGPLRQRSTDCVLAFVFVATIRAIGRARVRRQARHCQARMDPRIHLIQAELFAGIEVGGAATRGTVGTASSER